MDPDLSVGVDPQDIGGLFRIVQVAHHDGGTGHADLAFLTVGEFLGGIGLEDGDDVGEQGIAHGETAEVSVAAAAGGGGDLTHAVALRQGELGSVVFQESVELVLQTLVHGVAAGTGSLKEAQVKTVCHFLGVHQLFIVVGNQKGMGRFVFFNEVSDFVGIEFGDDHFLQTQRQGHVEGSHDAVGGEGRDDVHEPLFAGIADTAVTEVHGNGVEAVVGDHDALGHAGGAAGESDGGGLMGAVGDRFGLDALAVGKELFPGDHIAGHLDLGSGHLHLLEHADGRGHIIVHGDDDDLLKIKILQGLTKMIVGKIDDQCDFGTGGADHLFHFLAGAAGIQREERGTDFVGTVKGEDHLRNGDGEACHRIAGFDAEGGKGACSPVNVLEQLCVADLVSEEVQCGVDGVVVVVVPDALVNGLMLQLGVLCLFTEELHPGFFNGRVAFHNRFSSVFSSCGRTGGQSGSTGCDFSFVPAGGCRRRNAYQVLPGDRGDNIQSDDRLTASLKIKRKCRGSPV